MDFLFVEEPKVETLLRTSSCFHCAQQKEKRTCISHVTSTHQFLANIDKQHSYIIDWLMTRADW